MKATFKGKYSSDNVGSASSTLAFKAGDVTLKASVTDATFVAGPSSKGLVFAFEKPGFFVVDYKFDKKDFGFRFMNRVSVWEKPLDLTYSHSRNENGTTLDGRLAFNSDNKVSANYRLDSGNWKLKYTYVHNGLTTFEPSYDFAKSAWDFALSRRVYDDNVFKATYQTANDTLGLEWSRSSKLNGSFKISATCNMAEEKKKPKLTAETSIGW